MADISGILLGAAVSATSFAGTVKNVRLSMASYANSSTILTATVARPLSILAVGISSSTMNGGVAIKGEIESSSASASTMAVSSPSETATMCMAINDVLQLWGIRGICSAPDFAVARAISDLNSAMQTIWNQAKDRNYWTSETLTLTFDDGETEQDLPSNIQNVVGPCRLASNRQPLATIGTIGELESFSDLYLDGGTAAGPLAYYVERMNQGGNDPAKTVLHLTPAVAGDNVSFLLEVVREAPRFTLGQLNYCPSLPIPHRYVESLLMPILRYKATSFYLFEDEANKPTIDRDYQIAMEALGLADPLPGKSGDNKEGASK